MMMSAGLQVTGGVGRNVGTKVPLARIANGRLHADVGAVGVDVSVRSEIEAAVDSATAEFDQLDIMCNIAGIGDEGPLIGVTEERLDRTIAVNLKGTLFGCQAAARVMVARGRGHIINVSTTGIDVPQLPVGAYSVTKAAVAMLSMTLAQQLGPSGIRVNVIAPGATLTAFSTRNLYDEDGVLDEAGLTAYVERMRAFSPLGLVGEADDQALLIVYLVSPAGRLASGNIFRVNGGFSMAW